MKKILFLLFIFSLIIPLVSFASIDTNLKYGSRGTDVSELQDFLISKGFLTGQATGNFFSLTRNAVVSYQISVGVPSTGFVGPMTREKINTELLQADTSSNQAEITETGLVVSIPTKDDPVTILQKQIDSLLAQLRQLNSQVQAQTTIQQQTQTTLQQTQQNVQQTQQNVQQIQQNTTPPITVIQPSTPTIVKDLIVTSDKTSVQITGWSSSIITAQFTENGKPVPVEVSFSGPDDSKKFKIVQTSSGSECGGIPFLIKQDGVMGGGCSQDGKISFRYQPKSLGTHTVNITANGISKSINIEATEYIKIDPKFKRKYVYQDLNADGTGEPVEIPEYPIGYQNVTIANFNLSDADEPFKISNINFESDIEKDKFIILSDGYNIFDDNRINNENTNYQIKIKNTADVSTGTHNLIIKEVFVARLNSGLISNIEGLPITFTFIIK